MVYFFFQCVAYSGIIQCIVGVFYWTWLANPVWRYDGHSDINGVFNSIILMKFSWYSVVFIVWGWWWLYSVWWRILWLTGLAYLAILYFFFWLILLLLLDNFYFINYWLLLWGHWYWWLLFCVWHYYWLHRGGPHLPLVLTVLILGIIIEINVRPLTCGVSVLFGKFIFVLLWREWYLPTTYAPLLRRHRVVCSLLFF